MLYLVLVINSISSKHVFIAFGDLGVPQKNYLKHVNFPHHTKQKVKSAPLVRPYK